MWVLRAIVVLLLLWPRPAAAQGGTDFIQVNVVDVDGNPLNVGEIGCSLTEDPAPRGYDFDPRCTNCASAQCYSYGEEWAWKGAYFIHGEDGAQFTYEAEPYSGVYGLWPNSLSPWDERHNFVLWGGGWEGVHVVTFTVSTPPPAPMTPTPIPTLTPMAVRGPSSVNFVEGFDEGFTESFGLLSGYGIIPDFGASYNDWLFAARKWIQVINQGNLLYVMGGILMAVLVLRWAVDRLKNPR